MLTSPSGEKMIQRISPIYAKSQIEQAIYQAIGTEWDSSYNLVDEVLLQLFPQTATWGLAWWEQRNNLPTNLNEDIEIRRGKVIAKMQTRFPITPERIANVLKNYTRADVFITEGISSNIFEVLLETKTTINGSLQEIIEQVNKLKPSHMNYNLVTGYLEDVIAEISYNFWFSEPIELCGTIDVNGNISTTTDGRRYGDIFLEKIKEYFSNTLPISSTKLYPNGSLGKSFSENIKDMKKAYFSNVLQQASNNTVMYFTDGIRRTEILADKKSYYSSIPFRTAWDGNFICMIDGLSKNEKVTDKYSKYFSQSFPVAMGSDGLRKNEYITDKCSMFLSVDILQCSPNAYCGGGVYA